MNIAIVADEGKKELLTQFCLTYCSVLSKNSLIAEETMAHIITKSTGLKIETILSNGQEGKQQILSRIAYKEIDMLLFFKNPLDKQSDLNSDEIFKTCNTHNVIFATNLATAEALISNLPNNNNSANSDDNDEKTVNREEIKNDI